jgi:molecular chaperone HtpG
MEFKTELKQILDLIIHSLYSHKEIFLRELVSNACDAIDKARFEALTKPEVLENNAEWKIKLSFDAKARTLTVSDNGIGMSQESIVENLGTIARSGTKEFLTRLRETDTKSVPELIGQFGVGFYASYMVADKVTVETRMAGGKGVRWVSDGQGSYTVEECEKAGRGTDVIVHLKKEEEELLTEWRLREIIKKYSDFIEHPIVMDVERDKKIVEETLNSRQAIWLKPKAEVTDTEYHEFYKHISHDFTDPLKTIHYAAEGAMEFKALLYFPAKKPFDLFHAERKQGLHLYIKRVFIMDECKELLPEYLRFVKGVVDSADLPLNVSREILQHSALLSRIRKNLVAKILKELEDMKANAYDTYVTFYKEFGAVLKEGLHTDFENKDKIAELMLFGSMHTPADQLLTLKQYCDAAPADQEEMYFFIGDDRAEMEKSPYLEAFRSKGHDVLFMTDHIDEWVVMDLPEYGKKKLKAVDKGEIKQGKVEEITREEKQKELKGLLEALQAGIPEVKDIRLSSRLTESASCLVADESDVSAHLERILRKMGPELQAPENKRIMELNAGHPVVANLQKIFTANQHDAKVADYGRLLYYQAVIAEGSKVKDPLELAKLINSLLAKDALTL